MVYEDRREQIQVSRRPAHRASVTLALCGQVLPTACYTSVIIMSQNAHIAQLLLPPPSRSSTPNAAPTCLARELRNGLEASSSL